MGLEQGNRGGCQKIWTVVGLEGLGYGSKILDEPLAMAGVRRCVYLLGILSIEQGTFSLQERNTVMIIQCMYITWQRQEAKQRGGRHRLRYVV